VSAPELTCQEMVELVTDFLEDRLGPAERARFEAHLALCEGCRAYLDQMRQTVRALGRIPDDSMSTVMRDQLLDAFRGWRRRA
jgi:anti-sigma factor RsiW